MNLTPPSWCFSCGLGEDPCEMALVGESAPEGYFNQREICHEHQILGHVDAPLHQPAMWRNSSAASKCSGKVADGKPALAGNLSQRELSIEICVDRISREPQLPRSQPSTHQGSRKTHAAIDACKVYIQRGRDLINELVVGAVMPFDSRYQTVAEVQNDRIAGGDAGLYAKLDDSVSAVIVRKPIESGSRNKKVKAVRIIFGIGRRIKRQMNQANRVMWKGDYLAAAVFWFARSEDISLQRQDESPLGRRRMVR